MAKKRASLRGRGTEILMGARQDKPSEVDAASEAQDSSSEDDSGDVPLQELPLADEPRETADAAELVPEWAALLQEEALSASGKRTPESGVGAAPELHLPPLATTPARPGIPVDGTEPTPGGERFPEPVDDNVLAEIKGELETDTAIEPPPSAPAVAPATATAVSGPVTPPAPMYNESYGFDSTGGATMPAPKEKPEATDAGMRLKLGGLLYGRTTVKPSAKDLEPKGPEGDQVEPQKPGGDEVGQPARKRQEPEPLALVGRAQRDALWAETLDLYRDVPDLLTGDANQSRALQFLQEAQGFLLAEPCRFDMAKFRVSQVQSLVSGRLNVNRWSKTYGWAVFFYEIVWIVTLALGIVGAKRVTDGVLSFVGGEPAQGFVLGLWSTMLWGGLGGVIGAFYSLYWHVAKIRDFDKRYSMWYVVQPVMGLLLGALVYLLIGVAFVSVQRGANVAESFGTLFFRFAVACIVGFRQSFVLEIVDRMIQVITPAPRPKAAEQGAGAEEPPASG